ncbi:Protein of unknown function (DUF788), putative [Trypanosoma equiperdum]|uniref:Transmembrane protein 208 n=4 Tax=Trypanozoon TaxID=39700 RepID=Q38FE8_TRYB2|nr:hypothetical protein, conserved [Trypanosoma brucei gambiense DAL972]XP_803688.1 hypothetical protein, conserved [Trypanosoma brucei brucei TREU927]RHW70675.1 hypothetical protein DPX39_090015100 [Trypanosoma brucei equiperdum]SCU68968.1 Protein of unknown function (DUF788), putative [Trypanosoma equiperdum]EAN76472.1 hypothetical protein, conserved [Trypanosoma brucei brucei TREU927]CBH14129.1 hypothetical protein, conserved [Trypanosoma brucei gambiense DAL972]|eukprot:XP_011776400.1 hypothetical protein, conserved [Trypanosoma brucei gambiense DAL972]
MAKDTAKKNMRGNAVRMQVFSLITLTVNVICFLVSFWRQSSFPGFGSLAALAFWAGQEYASLALLKHFARPVFNAEGELLDCPDASDPKELGYYSLAQDVLWVCWVVQVLCFLFHWGFMVLYLPVPVMGLYKLWGIIGPLLTPAQPAAGEGCGFAPGGLSRAERRKMELQQRKKRV